MIMLILLWAQTSLIHEFGDWLGAGRALIDLNMMLQARQTYLSQMNVLDFKWKINTSYLFLPDEILNSEWNLKTSHLFLPCESTGFRTEFKFEDLDMMLQHDGRERTKAQWARLFAASGFEPGVIVAPHCPHYIIEALPI